jgi:hypothetical protein
MIAKLHNGRYSDANIPEARIMKESTMQQMHSTLYTPDPHLQGIAYGLFDFSDNGLWTLGHSGYMEYMNGLLLLLPDQDLGVYLVYNSNNVEDLNNQHLGFQRAFFDHYYPAPAVEPLQPPADFAERASRFVGSYRGTMRSYTTADKIGALFGEAQISAPGDGTLQLNLYGLELRFVEVEPLYFRQGGGQFSLIFREDDRGRITHMATDLTPQFAYEKLGWYETFGYNMSLLQGSALIVLSMILVAGFVLIRDHRRSRNQISTSRNPRTALWIIIGISVMNLVVIVYSFLWLYPVMLFGFSTLSKIVLGLGVLAAVLTAGALIYSVLAWKDSYWSPVFRAYYTLVTVAALAFVWFLNYWNLLGWRY